MANYLIIARSARALAASAKRAGHKVHSMDCFIDDDTKKISDSVNQLKYEDEGFIEEQVLGITQALVSEYQDIVIVTGSGFEAKPKQLSKLRELAPLISNDTDTICDLKRPDRFSKLMSKHSIKRPLTLLSKPKTINNYLSKRIAGTGGEQVRWLQKDDADLGKDYYYQEFVSGDVLSALFLANGERTALVGFNRQLQTNKFDNMPFLYQGAMTLNSLDLNLISKKQKDEILRVINVITNETGLTGLCGLDFILDEEGDINVLEVNPRPPATFELHEHKQSLFDAHVSCFLEKSIDYEQEPVDYSRAYAILYANNDINITKDVAWPSWVKDRPIINIPILSGFPVCTVHADASSNVEAKTLLFKRLNQIESEIRTMQNAA